MLPQNISDTQLSKQIADKQTNYLILRTLESKLPPEQFKGLISQIEQSMELPTHTVWDGQQVSSSYEELKSRQGVFDDTLLSELVQQFQQGKNTNSSLDPTNVQTLTNFLRHQKDSTLSGSPNVFSYLSRSLGLFNEAVPKERMSNGIDNFKRVKTVFCHADFTTDEVSSIYNVQFDQTGSFIVSGADDGVIKVWDRETLTLQASLHGHFDYITEIVISKCNKYIASAGKDAQVIIWELETGKLVQKLTHHSKLINCIKFFCPKSSSVSSDISGQPRSSDQPQYQQGPQQFLFSCSDDGTVRLYDFTAISGWKKTQQQVIGSQTATRTSEEEACSVRRSSRQNKQTSISSSAQPDQTTEEALYSIELTPDDYRPGARNKKLETLVINYQGLVVAGSATGEQLIWRLNYENIRKRAPKQDCQTFIGSFKMPRQSVVKFCEFSPKNGIQGIGEILMTGSGDGVVKLWRMQIDKKPRGQTKQSVLNLEDKSRLILQIDENRGCLQSKQIKQTDPSGEEKVEWVMEEVPSEGVKTREFKFCKSQCDAVKWSLNGRFAISAITSKIENQNSEEICRIKIWDTVNQTFYDDLAKLSGIVIQKNLYVLATHPIDENILMTGSEGGLVILWDIKHKKILKQFRQYGVYSIDANIMENPLDGKWSPCGRAFITGGNLGTITLYSCEDKDHQYEATRVQQFFQFDIAKHQDNPFEKINNKPSVCGYNMMPYEVQPERFLIRFTELDENTDAKKFQRNLNLAKELGNMEEKYYQDQLQQSLFGGLPHPSSQNVEMIDARPQQYMRLDQSDDDDEAQQRHAQVIYQEQQNRDQPANRGRPGRPRLQRNNEREALQQQAVVQNQQQTDSLMVSSGQISQSESPDDSLESESAEDLSENSINHRRTRRLQNNTSRSRRPQRAARPQNLRDIETVQDEESLDVRRTRRQRQRRNLSESSIESYCSSLDDEEDENDDLIQQSPVLDRNGRTRYERRENYGSNRNRVVRMDNLEPSNNRVAQLEIAQSNSRNNRGRNKTKQEDEDFSPEQGLKGLFYLSDNNFSEQKNEKVEISSHMLQTASKHIKDKPDLNFELQKNPNRNQSQPCSLCNRIDGEIVGPFTNKKNSVQLYLHKDCIEINSYSYFNYHSGKWVNIETMLKYLQEDAQYHCFRCGKDGASISCYSCGRNFHGYYCAGMYNIISPLDKQIEGPASMLCLFCQNQNNYEDYSLNLAQMGDQELKRYLDALKKIDKSHLLKTTSQFTSESYNQKSETYLPQIDDVLLYFFQGHENYIYQYNCHFYAGQSKIFPYNIQMPWIKEKFNFRDQEIVLVKVVNIVTLFPSRRSMALMDTFGKDSTSCCQTPQMIQRIELQFIQKELNFTIDLMPNELPDFLVPYQIFDLQRQKYQAQSLVGKNVNVRTKQGVKKLKIVSEQPLESSLYPRSLWQTLVCTPVINSTSQQRMTRNLSSDGLDSLRINFWDIVFDDTTFPDMNAFKEHEHSKLSQTINIQMVKLKDYLVYFSDRVIEKIAPEYRQTISQEMWFRLIVLRIQNKYYRSQKQLLTDIDQVVENAKSYNGKEHDIAVDAETVSLKIRTELLKCIDSVGDSQLKQRIKEAQRMSQSQKMVTGLVKELSQRAQQQNQEVQIDTTQSKPLYNSRDIEESKEEIMPTKKRGRPKLNESLESELLLDFDSAPIQQASSNAGEVRSLRKRQRIL